MLSEFKQVFLYLFLSCISTILSLLVLENILQIVYKKNLPNQLWRTGSIYQSDKELIYSLKPNTDSIWKTSEFNQIVHINNMGFRRLENTDLYKPKNSYRIIMVGDSFTFGHGLSYQNTYPFIIERSIKSNYLINNVEVFV